MGLIKTIKQILAGAALTGALWTGAYAAEPTPVTKDNEYMHDIIKTYFAEKPNYTAYRTNEFFFFRKPERSVSKFEELLNQLDTPEKINEFCQKQKYTSDKLDGHKGADFMESPLEFYLSGRGDCEDYANFADYALKKHGYESCMLVVNTLEFVSDKTEYKHAFCLINNKKEKTYEYIDTNGYFTGFKDIDALFRHVIAQYYGKSSPWLTAQNIQPDYSNPEGCKEGWKFHNPCWWDEVSEEVIKTLPKE